MCSTIHKHHPLIITFVLLSLTCSITKYCMVDLVQIKQFEFLVMWTFFWQSRHFFSKVDIFFAEYTFCFLSLWTLVWYDIFQSEYLFLQLFYKEMEKKTTMKKYKLKVNLHKYITTHKIELHNFIGKMHVR